MKVSVKTLQNTKYTVEVDPTEKVLAVKERLHNEHNIGPAAQQKLIFQGRVLADDSTFADYKISENDFLVVMVSKAPAAAAPAATTAAAPVATPAAPSQATTTAPTPAAAVSPVPAAQEPAAQSTSSPATTSGAVQPAPAPAPAPAVAPASTTAAVGTTPAASGASAFVVGPELETTVMQMMEMGFERDQCIRALRAAYNNPDRAIEYLFSGIPEGAGMGGGPRPTGGSQAPAVQPAPPAQGTAVPGTQMPNLFPPAEPQAPQGAGPLDFLRTQPQFQQLRQVVQQNPALLQPLLQQIGQSNPTLLELINQHQEEFFRLLEEDMPGAPGGGSTVIEVTQEEQEALERLASLGFDRTRVLEAFLACERDEALAANYLFDHANEED